MIKQNRRLRPALMTGAAMMGLIAGTSAAQAEDLAVSEGGRLAYVAPEAHADEGDQTARLLADAAAIAAQRQEVFTYQQQAFVRPDVVELDPYLQIANPGTPTTARDPNNITGIGQIVIDSGNGNGSLGLCTGTLINPRTVLFAAHCVNTRAATAYGANTGGVGIAVGFENNLLANAPGQTSELVRYIFGDATGAGRLQTNTANALYNADFVVYNPLSTQPGNGFLYADVAIASLDTPTRGIPTWALLLSPLPAPTAITAANGTGYHVTIAGYGNNGTGETGANGGIDFRRRVAENWLGGLASLDDFQNFIFGSPTGALPQNLYWIDFDDPRRGTASASRFDFNSFRDNALPNEGGTAPGDSGGPLILDRQFSRQLVLGVLSGGFSRFFNGQVSNGYGSNSFYQPLYLYWDWIAANNPYRYVSANAGNGNWEDASRWVTLTDPNYFILGPNGQPINGVPSLTGEANTGTSGKFGQICFQNNTSSDCLDVKTGVETITTNPIGTAENGMGFAILDGAEGATNQPGSAFINADGAALESQAAAAPLPAATIANGLPGATNFVPNNTAGNRLQGVLPRYFDVTLSNTGTTTLSSTVTIDRLTVRNTAGLTINTGARLNSLIDVTQAGGTVTVNGTLSSVGDFALLAGMLQGTGTIIAPFTTSVLGGISPGTMGTVGTLNFTGNLVLSSGTVTVIDIAGTAADRISVTGAANVGGTVAVSGINGQVNGLGRQFTIVSATGGVTGTFSPLQLSPLLRQSFTYQPNAVLLQINAASYNTVINPVDPVQVAYAQLFDQNRAVGALSANYALDFASIETIRDTFARLAPLNEQAVRSLAAQSINTLQNFNDARLREADKDHSGGKVAITGRPLELAQMSLSPAMQPLGGAVMGAQEGAGETEMREADLPDNVGVFLAGGFVVGNGASLPGYAPGAQVFNQFRVDPMDYAGYYLSGGIEFYPGESTMIGLSGYYSDIDADVPLAQEVRNTTYAASLYMRHSFDSGVVVDGQFSMGSSGFDTRRAVTFLNAIQTLESTSDNLLVSGALGVSYDLETSLGTISPGIEARYASIDFDQVQETGGPLALSIDRQTYKSTQLRGGFDWQKQGKNVQLNATAQVVRELEQGSQVLGANFVGGTGPNAAFAFGTADRTWGEAGVSANFGSGPVQVGIAFDTTIARSDADTQVVRGTASWKF